MHMHMQLRRIIGYLQKLLYTVKSGIAVGVGNSNLRWQQDPC
jgi:hypothetical protein